MKAAAAMITAATVFIFLRENSKNPKKVEIKKGG